MYKQFKLCRSGVPISGPILIKKANLFHLELEISESCKITTGWLHKLKLSYGIRYLSTKGENFSIHKKTAYTYIGDSSELEWDEKLTPE